MANCKRNKRKKNLIKEISYKKDSISYDDWFQHINFNEETLKLLNDALSKNVKINESKK